MMTGFDRRRWRRHGWIMLVIAVVWGLGGAIGGFVFSSLMEVRIAFMFSTVVSMFTAGMFAGGLLLDANANRRL